MENSIQKNEQVISYEGGRGVSHEEVKDWRLRNKFHLFNITFYQYDFLKPNHDTYKLEDTISQYLFTGALDVSCEVSSSNFVLVLRTAFFRKMLPSMYFFYMWHQLIPQN